MYIRRSMETFIERAGKSFKAVLVTGARQVGKSTLLHHLYPKLDYLTFDDLVLLAEAKREPGLFFMSHPAPVILDEIQYIQQLFPYIKMECDAKDAPGMFVLTGSQSFRLMKNVSETLAGRVAIFELSGLSLREIDGAGFDRPFIPTPDYIAERARCCRRHKNIWEIIHRGSYPALYESEKDWQTFYSSYIQTYLYRDINDFLRVKDQMKFTRFLTAMAARTGQMLNYSKVGEQADVTAATAKEWTSLLEASGIVAILPPFSNSALTRAVKTPKLYFRDTGLACFLTRHQTPGTAMSGAMAGELFETFVVSEILKSFSNAGLDYRMYLSYYRGKDKAREAEIDILVEDENTIYPVEIKMTANPRPDMTKNFDVLDKIKGKKRGRGILLSLYDRPVYLNEGAISLPVDYV